MLLAEYHVPFLGSAEFHHLAYRGLFGATATVGLQSGGRSMDDFSQPGRGLHRRGDRPSGAVDAEAGGGREGGWRPNPHAELSRRNLGHGRASLRSTSRRSRFPARLPQRRGDHLGCAHPDGWHDQPALRPRWRPSATRWRSRSARSCRPGSYFEQLPEQDRGADRDVERPTRPPPGMVTRRVQVTATSGGQPVLFCRPHRWPERAADLPGGARCPQRGWFGGRRCSARWGQTRSPQRLCPLRRGFRLSPCVAAPMTS